VTGGGTGIGRGIAERLAAEGMKVVICGRRPEPLEETAALMRGEGGEVMARVADVSEAAQVAELFEAIERAGWTVDAVVHNAMQMRMHRFAELTAEQWEGAFATACRGAYLVARQAIPSMRARGRGNLVFISSVGAARAHRPGLPYDAAKAALEAMVRALGVEYAAEGIRVNGVAPGAIKSRGEITAAALGNPHIPLLRMGTTDEVASLVAFLLSEQASYLTAQTICLDGGLTAQLSPPGIRV